MSLKIRREFKLVDLVGIGVFFLVLASAFFFLLRRPDYLTLVLRVSEQDSLGVGTGVPMWYLEKLKKGMVQKDLLGRNDIEILDKFSQKTNSRSNIVYLTMRILTTHDRKNKTYNYQGVPILVGSYQTFKIGGILLRGVVQRMEEEGFVPEIQYFELEGFLNPALIANQDPYVGEMVSNGVLNYLADKFSPGMVINDSTGDEVVKIIKIDIEPATKKFISGDRLVEIIDHERKRVKLKIKIKTEKYGDVFLYRQVSPIKINDNIYLDFWDIGVDMTIVGFRRI